MSPSHPLPAVFFPVTLRKHLGISETTLWRNERRGLIPPRDVRIGARTGWRRETIEAAIALEPR